MANRLSDLEIGHSHAPSLFKDVTSMDFLSSDPTPGTVVLVGLVVLAAYSIVWNLMLRR